jgi:hypothetical protein
MSQKIRAQNAIVAALKTRKFPVVTYDVTTGLATQTTAEDGVAAKAVFTNEVSARFAVDKTHGRALKMVRTAWFFGLILEFDREVTIEAFESEMADEPIILPRQDDLPGLRLLLVQTSHQHPVQQSASGGSRCELLFAAEEFKR